MKTTRALAFIAFFGMLLGCSHGPAPGGGPQGWTKISTGTWASGSGSSQQRYTLTTTPFGGSLKDLASEQTINVVLRDPGARFVQSTPFPNCPGQAGVATFRLPKAIVEDGFALQGDDAVTIFYRRPAGVDADPEVLAAMNASLCVPPA